MAGKLRVESPGAIYRVNTPEIAPASNLPIAAVVYGSNIFVYHWTGEGVGPTHLSFSKALTSGAAALFTKALPLNGLLNQIKKLARNPDSDLSENNYV